MSEELVSQRTIGVEKLKKPKAQISHFVSLSEDSRCIIIQIGCFVEYFRSKASVSCSEKCACEQCTNIFDEKMNYFDYLCGVYQICFRAPAKLTAVEKHRPKSEPKFFDYSEKPISESFIGASTVNLYSQRPNSLTKAKPSQFQNSDSDVIPKSCAGDWVLRYSQNETNFNPFAAKFSNFELVPWRQQNKRIDLANAIGWEPVKLTQANHQQLRTLQKFELARSKRLQKQRLKSQKDRFRRQIKIRFIFSLEVRQKKMKLFRPNRTMTTYQRQLVLQRDQQIFVFNEQAYDLAEHWGYFSQRNKGVEELLVNSASQLDLSRAQRSITYPTGSVTSSRRNSPESVAKTLIPAILDMMPCEKCRSRCVDLISISFRVTTRNTFRQIQSIRGVSFYRNNRIFVDLFFTCIYLRFLSMNLLSDHGRSMEQSAIVLCKTSIIF